MTMLKQGDKGSEVKRLQNLLGIKADGIFGPLTRKAVIRFQLYNNIDPDGVVGNQTWAMLLSTSFKNEAIDTSSDSSEQYFRTNYNQVIHKYYLPESEYVQMKLKNFYIVLHHTAGTFNPYHIVDQWAKDNRGRIATEFVIGGQDHRTGNDEFDGRVIQAFPYGNLAWHIGESGSGNMNKTSVGIELCAMGYLTSDYKTYVNSKVIESQVITLPERFKGYINYHSYSDEQIKETEKLLRHIAERDNIDLRLGLQQWIKKYGPNRAFDYHEEAYYGKAIGLLSHGNIRKDKTDVYPDPRLVDMILSL